MRDFLSYSIRFSVLLSLLYIGGLQAAASLEELTVTADRRFVEYQQTMATRDFYTNEELVQVDADHISELLNRGAGVNFHRGNGVEFLAAIRSPVLTGGAGAGSFLYLEDGISIRSPGFSNVNGLTEGFYEAADSIELVKGPGSALYGSNAVHGLVNIASPIPGSSRDFVRVSGGSHGFTQLQGGKNFVNRDRDIRVDALIARDDGWRSDSGFDQQKFKLQRQVENKGISQRTVLDAFNLEQNTAGFAQGEDAYRIASLAEGNTEPDAFRRWHSFRLHHRVASDPNAEQSWVFTPYVRHNQMKFRLHFLPGEALEENQHDSIGLQTSRYLKIGAQNIIYGVDTEITDGELYVFQENPDAGFGLVYPQGVHYDYKVLAKTLSGFVQNRTELSGSTTLELGLRLEYVHYDYDNRADTAVIGRIKRIADRRDDFTLLTPKLSLSQKTPLGAFTFKASRGERAPQTTDLYRIQINQEGGDAEVETIDSLEIQHLYQLNSFVSQLNVFWMQKDNFFFRDADGFNVSNGKTKHQGGELKLDYQVTERISFIGDATYAKHQYDFDKEVLSIPAETESVTRGDDIDSAPRKLANLRLKYAGDKTSHNLEWRYVGPYYMDASNQNRYPGHQVLVYRGSAQLTDKTKLFWRVNNLTNARYPERADFAFGNERYFPGERIAGFIGLDLTL